MQNNIHLSPHFELKEFTKSATAKEHGIDNTPPEEAVENLRALCVHTLEPLREALGLPIIIASGYRTKALNDLLAHSSKRSQHMQGQAADFYVQGSENLVPSSTAAEPPVQGSNFNEKEERQESPVLDSKTEAPEKGDNQEPTLNFEHGTLNSARPTRRELLIKAFRLIITSEQIDYDQLILYPTFIHVSYVSRERNRRKLTRAFGNGSYAALSREAAMKLT